ncbi:MAG: ATP-binding protein, partial [Alphaproteobacteria bacterium]|nr:ATP-binding protein [Alphaproteobacteria bacterium]
HIIHYQDTAKMTQKHQLRAARTVKQADSPMVKFLPELLEQAKEARFVGAKVRENGIVVQSFFSVVVVAEDTLLDDATNTMKNVYRTRGWELDKETFIQLPSLMMHLPFLPAEGYVHDMARLGRMRSHLSTTVSNMLPIVGDWKGMNSPCVQLVSRNGEVFFWDPFSNNAGNYNCCVVGKSGSGKSVFMQDMVAGICGNGGHCIVVDDGYSFFNSCLLQGGHHLSFSADDAVSINPFSLVDEMAFQFDKDYASNVISMINAMIRQMTKQVEKTNDIENALISEAIDNVWAKHGKTGTVTHVAKELDAYEDKHGQYDQRASDISLSLKPYCKDGQFGSFFEGQCKLDVSSHLVVFELSEIKSRPELRSQALLVIMFLASNKMYSSGRVRNTAVFLDEAWDLLSGEGSKAFIEGMARRARKYRGAIITGTQSVNDYYANPAALATFENSDWMVMLAQKEESIEKLKKSGNLTVDDALGKSLRSLRMVDFEYSECLIKGADFYAIGRLIVDPFSIVLYSSKGEDVNEIKTLQEAGLSLSEALLQYAATQAKKRGIDLKFQTEKSRAELAMLRKKNAIAHELEQELGKELVHNA